ncbi:hypothetical protein H8356DRAFT_935438 [Neocallimastix lanati (nom. inval.)]|uniref:BZIP domain-containing protein n=1 Tax=Neocallimastix californiae TaxID=1754190 RepID=A0A1Y2EX45_9FUNG|nr:hypothetical protein H8356DRAFT_935438 [Neocallimastix sp. JGI-2020a]ORY76138.1 hypothetical protein LY90DRAFT_501852 [Neocallimastix californiae]|eukprot:ORY76138.1 hypothetical protein LY90DRAFT_501852 [Neocallimastix californiae]
MNGKNTHLLFYEKELENSDKDSNDNFYPYKFIIDEKEDKTISSLKFTIKMSYYFNNYCELTEQGKLNGMMNNLIFNTPQRDIYLNGQVENAIQSPIFTLDNTFCNSNVEKNYSTTTNTFQNSMVTPPSPFTTALSSISAQQSPIIMLNSPIKFIPYKLNSLISFSEETNNISSLPSPTEYSTFYPINMDNNTQLTVSPIIPMEKMDSLEKSIPPSSLICSYQILNKDYPLNFNINPTNSKESNMILCPPSSLSSNNLLNYDFSVNNTNATRSFLSNQSNYSMNQSNSNRTVIPTDLTNLIMPNQSFNSGMYIDIIKTIIKKRKEYVKDYNFNFDIDNISEFSFNILKLLRSTTSSDSRKLLKTIEIKRKPGRKRKNISLNSNNINLDNDHKKSSTSYQIDINTKKQSHLLNNRNAARLSRRRAKLEEEELNKQSTKLAFENSLLKLKLFEFIHFENFIIVNNYKREKILRNSLVLYPRIINSRL